MRPFCVIILVCLKERNQMNNIVAIVVEDETYQENAKTLSLELNIPIEDAVSKETEGLWLVYTEKGLKLTDGKLSMMGDLSEMSRRIKKNNLQNEMLVKASKIKNDDHRLVAIDATAGMGEDALLLAAAGFTVYLYEYDQIIASLLEDSLMRAEKNTELSAIVGRMHLIKGDSILALKSIDFRPDVVLLDPMFPERNKSALIKKKFQLLQQLESPCSNEEELLEAALIANPHKIVIKRPLKGPKLAGAKVSYSLSGKAIRYDCIVIA